jgi:hypothetical protein
MYILRVVTWATPYTMTLWTWITNPYSELTLLTANTVHQFGFLAVDWNLELQPSVTQSWWWTWWSITWTLSDQTDLQSALNNKQDKFHTTSSSQPSNPSEWDEWYDSTNDVLKVYDGSNWNVTGKEYNAGTWIKIETWTIQDYSAMQWPAPDEFHVPLNTEWQWVKTIMDWLSLTTWDDWRIKLHIPFAGRRSSSYASLDLQGSYGIYWSSSPYGSSNPNRASSLDLNSSNVNANNGYERAYGLSVRCFKNSYVAPDPNWTVIQGTLWSAWIFWDQSEWLISITDWTIGYTIMDKNLWATTVYNNWDTLSEANCGKYYQWWNNYGFDWIGGTNIITSSTQVNAQNYWPWNYYESDTFITWSQDWSSFQNDNLWWWVTWVVTLLDNTITNTGVLSVNWQTGDVTVWWSWWSITWTLSDQTDLNTALWAKANASDVNTKTFEVEELTVSELQPVMDFYANWWYPIIYYSDSWTEYPRRRWYYTLAYPPSSSTALFKWEMGNANTFPSGWYWQSTTTSCISISLSDWTVTSASFQNSDFINYLSTSQTNDQYTPKYNYDPATKKYVDDIKPTSWSKAPATTPSYVGQQYVDTTNNKLYVATWTSSSSDWTEVWSWWSWWWGNVIAMTQSEYNALTIEEKNDWKLRIITDAPTEDISVDWDNVANKKVDLSTQTWNLSELKFWIWTTKAYQNLDSYDNNTVYICKQVIS